MAGLSAVLTSGNAAGARIRGSVRLAESIAGVRTDGHEHTELDARLVHTAGQAVSDSRVPVRGIRGAATARR